MKPTPPVTVQVTPLTVDTHWNGPAPVAAPYANTGVAGEGLPSSHRLPEQVAKEPDAVIVASRGGANVAQRTSWFATTSMRHAMFFDGEKKAPFNVALVKRDATTTVAVSKTLSRAHLGGGPMTCTTSVN